MLSPAEVKFLAILVQKGHLEKSGAEKIFASASQSKEGLDAMLVQLGLFDPERLDFLHRTGGEEVPDVPGYGYASRAGFGGTAMVFHGVEKASGRDVALKVMHKELHADPLQVKRFVHEAKLLMKLDHPSIAKGVRVGHVKDRDGGDRLVFILEWIDGRSLLELLREGMEFEEDVALFIILQAAKGLKHMHERGVLHRDVKPDNILLTRDSQVKLIDLGFATMMAEQAADSGGADTTLGTAAYMSPEQAKGISDLDVRSDIYSLGATLFQIVVGDLPFKGEGTQEQLAARILEALSSPELQSRRISPHMNYFIRKMMEQDRDFRYADMGELIDNIEEQIRGKKTMIFGSEAGGEDLFQAPFRDDAPPDSSPPTGGSPKFPTRRRRR